MPTRERTQAIILRYLVMRTPFVWNISNAKHILHYVYTISRNFFCQFI